MRAHGSRACYVFGVEPGSDRSKGCRCEPCVEANRVYARERDRATRRPDVELEPAYIDATEVRKHLRMLSRRGVGLRTVAERAGLGRTALSKLKSGKVRRCRPSTADAILLVFPVDARAGAYVDAGPTWRLLDELIAHGYTRTDLARRLGSKAKTPALQLMHDRVVVPQLRLGVLSEHRGHVLRPMAAPMPARHRPPAATGPHPQERARRRAHRPVHHVLPGVEFFWSQAVEG